MVIDKGCGDEVMNFFEGVFGLALDRRYIVAFTKTFSTSVLSQVPKHSSSSSCATPMKMMPYFCVKITLGMALDKGCGFLHLWPLLKVASFALVALSFKLHRRKRCWGGFCRED